MATRSARTEKLDLRLSAEAKRRLVAAAGSARRSVSDFVLESALTRADETLADRTHFGLDDAHWAAFIAALDRPTSPEKPRLAELLGGKSLLE